MVVLRSLLLALAASSSALLLVAAKPHADGSCDATHQCDSTAPCCSSAGYCGKGSAYCLAGCNPYASLQLTSCAAMPRCKSETIDFTNNATPFVDLQSYTGNANVAPLTLDGGTVRPGKHGATMIVMQKGKNQGGTVLSTTRYVMYGTMSAKMRHHSEQGIVTAFMTMSPTGDELDYEFTTADPTNVQTNMYWNVAKEGAAYINGKTASNLPKNFTVSDWHDYSITWSPSAITWGVDGKTIRTLKRSSTDHNGVYHYPATPSRVQLSIWNAGGPDNAPGTRAWAGGPPKWSQADSTGAFTVEVASVRIGCSDPASLGAGKAYDFSKHTDSQSGEPKVIATDRSTTI